MSARKAAWIVCDDCGQQFPADLGCSTIFDASAQARAHGWHRIDYGKRQDFCAECWTEKERAREAQEKP